MMPRNTWGTWAYAYFSYYDVLTKDGSGPSSSMLMIPGTYWEDAERRAPSEALALLRSMAGARTKNEEMAESASNPLASIQEQ